MKKAFTMLELVFVIVILSQYWQQQLSQIQEAIL